MRRQRWFDYYDDVEHRLFGHRRNFDNLKHNLLDRQWNGDDPVKRTLGFAPRWLLGIVACFMLYACGGRSTQLDNQAQSTASITITWPLKTRVIPSGANSIVVILTLGATSVNSGPLARPTSGNTTTWRTPGMVPGIWSLTATAYPNANGTGNPQAVGNSHLTILAQRTTAATVTMGSTVTALAISPASPLVAVGGTQQVMASATDAQNNIVLIGPTTVTWSSGTPGVASVNSSGLASGLALGGSIITAKFTEIEPKLGQQPVATTTSLGVITAGLATSAWPKFHANNRNTGLSVGSGATGSVLWSHPTGGMVTSSPAIGADGTIYVGSDDNYVYALASNGGTKWTYPTGGAVDSSPAIGADGTVYVGAEDGYLYALTAAGQLRWKCNLGPGGITSPAIGSDGTLYVGAGPNLAAVTLSGTVKWSTGINFFAGTPAVGPDGTIYIPSYGGIGETHDFLDAVTPNGTIKWSSGIYFSGVGTPAVGSDGTIYFGLQYGGLTALNSDGTTRWTCQTNLLPNVTPATPAIASDGTIYLWDGNLFAVGSNGVLKWSYLTNSSGESSPAVGSDGTIYVGSDDFNVYAVTSAGALAWKFATGGTVTSSPAIGADGTIYIGSGDKALYAIH